MLCELVMCRLAIFMEVFMNLIYSNEGFRATKYTESQSYSLDEIMFFIEKKYVNLRLYLILKDVLNHIDIVKLKQVNSTNVNYYNYTCDVSYPLKINNGVCAISLIGINPNTEHVDLSSTYFTLSLENNLYNFKAQIGLLEQFNRNIADIYNKTFELYQKVVQMSEVNVQMLKEVKNL